MTRYLMSVYTTAEYNEFGNYPSEEAMKEAYAATGEFNERLQEQGYWVFADGLGPVTTATVVDGQGGRAGAHRRALPGVEGVHRRLLDHRGARPRRGAEAGRRGVEGLPGQGRGPSLRRLA